jgi:putative oxidoreductase
MTATELPSTAPSTFTAPRLRSGVLGAFRVVVSFMFICHGILALWGAWGGVDGQGGTAAFGTWPDWYGSALPLVAGAFVLVGLFTRPVALLASGGMAYAYFFVHLKNGVWPIPNGGELAAMFAWIYLLIAVVGPGAFAVDNLFRRRRAGV